MHLLDVAGPELTKRASQLSPARLTQLLQQALQASGVNSSSSSSSSSSFGAAVAPVSSVAISPAAPLSGVSSTADPFAEHLTVSLGSHNLIQQLEKINAISLEGHDGAMGGLAAADPSLRGYEAFTLDLRVEWPLSLVISMRSITKYQLLFRHLFFCKYVERRLCDSWRNHQRYKELELRNAQTSSYILRQRMLHFQQNFVYYMMVEVIQPRYHQFEVAMRGVSSIDDVLRCHGDFQDTCLKECLISADEKLLKILTKLMTICLLFADHTERFARAYKVDEEQATAAAAGQQPTGQVMQRNLTGELRRVCIAEISSDMRREVKQPSYTAMIARFASEFDDQLQAFMLALQADADIQVRPLLPQLLFPLVLSHLSSPESRALLTSLTLLFETLSTTRTSSTCARAWTTTVF